MSDSLRDALEEKFAKAAREMEREERGASRGMDQGRREAGGSPIAAMASAVFRPVQAMVSTVSSVLPGRRRLRRRIPRRRRSGRREEKRSKEGRKKAAVEVRLAGWTRSLDTVASVSDAVAVEGMKSLCHEVMAAVGDGEMLNAMAPDADRLVGLLADRVSPIFDAAVAAPGPSTTRACKYVLNTMMQVFREPTLAASVGEENERATVAMLLERLLDPNVPKMEEGPQLVKALNVSSCSSS